MSLSGAAAAMGVPETLVERSAAARAAESGASVDEILAAWAGGAAAPAPTPAAEVEPAAVEEAPAPDASESPAEPAIPVMEPSQPEAAAVAPAASAGRAPVPAEVTVAEAANLPEVVTVATAGIKERPNFVIPRWLVGLLLVAPLIALFALGGSATGSCGQATELRVDVISGQPVNCDGSEFTGGGAGGGATDFVALGGDIFLGNEVAGVNCSGCHGANGQGSATFPALTGVLTTFSSCTDHKEWVTLGSAGFPGGHGDTNKPTQGGMPSFGGSLTEEQIASVASYERVRFGGGNPDEVLADCGLVEGGDGEAPAGGEDGGTTGTTVPGEGTGTTVPASEASASHSG